MPKDTRTEASRAIGRRIREERIRAGLSRQGFARLLQTTPKQITNYEIGFMPSPHRLAQIARVLGRSFDYLRTGQGLPYATDVLQPAGPVTAAPNNAVAAVLMPALEPLIRRIVAEELNRALAQAAPPRGARSRRASARRGAGSRRAPGSSA